MFSAATTSLQTGYHVSSRVHSCRSDHWWIRVDSVLTGELNSAKAAEQVAGPRSITAQVPERYCDVDIYTAGGRVSVQSVTEGGLYVVSKAGSVKLGKIKATTAHVDTSGGRLICDTVTANVVDFQTNGGAISIKRLVGKQCSLDARPTAASLDAPGTAEDTTAVDTERGAVSVDVAYTESLTVMTKGRPITFGLLDTTNGAAQLCSNGGKVTVEGLDGTADLESKGGNIQVNLQENVRQLSATSRGGDIMCTLPPTLGSVVAVLEPLGQATFGEGVVFEKQDQGSVLHITSNSSPYAKQQSIFDRKHSEEQQHQSAEDHERLDSWKPPVRLVMNAQADPSDAQAESGGNVHVALESWISRATAKARAKLRE